ncbi:MAG: mechanosensitive ion channel family protein [Planctomycetota bacterium]|nr:MAG: mechanosensitive ion channel family protein [Planctomycetota bacterium]
MSSSKGYGILVVLWFTVLVLSAVFIVQPACSAAAAADETTATSPAPVVDKAKILVETFWQRHQKIIDSIKIFIGILIISYSIKLVIWLIGKVIAHLSTLPVGSRISVKRTGTLLSFAGSIAKLFVWIFGLVAILNVYGVNPATSAGAIGLIGLILAGMFQQIVIDFVKGLDIIAGRHYNVGDFIEVDGKYGYVLDFNAKYTRIRTVSGQEFSIPNSKCIPSRRFPDGYVDNYVDITLKPSADESRVIKSVQPVCEDLNQRIEPVKDVPVMVKQFAGPGGRLILRYRVRVLPGCDWVITDYFIPAVRDVLAQEGVELAMEPTFFFINRIETFRKLFSRRLSEQEIIRQTVQEETSLPPNEDQI